jgi:uncharacterized protein YraI
MRAKFKLMLAIAAAVSIALPANIATAAQNYPFPAAATANIKLRQGPGSNFPQIGVLPAREVVLIQKCQGSWCYAIRQAKDRPSGWVTWSMMVQRPN